MRKLTLLGLVFALAVTPVATPIVTTNTTVAANAKKASKKVYKPTEQEELWIRHMTKAIKKARATIENCDMYIGKDHYGSEIVDLIKKDNFVGQYTVSDAVDIDLKKENEIYGVTDKRKTMNVYFKNKNVVKVKKAKGENDLFSLKATKKNGHITKVAVKPKCDLPEDQVVFECYDADGKKIGSFKYQLLDINNLPGYGQIKY